MTDELVGNEPLPIPEDVTDPVPSVPEPERFFHGVPSLKETFRYVIGNGFPTPTTDDLRYLARAAIGCAIKGIPLQWNGKILAVERLPGPGSVEVVVRSSEPQ